MNYLCWLGLILSTIAVACLGFSGAGHRLGLWTFQTGISLLKCAGYFGLAGVAACVIGLVLSATGIFPGGLIPATIGLGIGSLVALWTWMWKLTLHSLPFIHDITTDTDNPPRFEAILAVRTGAPNSAEYGGPEVADKQKKGYPNLRPVTLTATPEATFALALQVANEMGWQIVASDLESRRIEATDTTRWFGFKDDIVVRITPSTSGSRIDVRSVSRVGKSDLGTNARRINAFLDRVTRTFNEIRR